MAICLQWNLKCFHGVWWRQQSWNPHKSRGNKIVDSCKYMGIQLSTSKAAENLNVDEWIGHAKGVVCAAKGLGSEHIPMPPSVMYQINWRVAVPKMLYGLEIVPIKERHISELEQEHRQFAKTIQGLSNNVPNPAPLATLGWVTIYPFVATRKLILALPSDNIYKRVTELNRGIIVQKGNDLFSNTPIWKYVWMCTEV